MCPLCWAALVSQVVFFVTLGVVLVVITDLKFGAPLSLVTLVLAGGNLWGGWTVAPIVLYLLVGALVLRGVWVLIFHEKNWVRQLASRIGGIARRVVRRALQRSPAKAEV
jgi:hypothetical protein